MRGGWFFPKIPATTSMKALLVDSELPLASHVCFRHVALVNFILCAGGGIFS
jgi:hypothetical protein